ncbi:hypothetical protein MTR67_033701 [Solanum verrucosum]|uniref:Uncharacterized protein n=1 Tax=Solanum verrucosum TaxID=315347 RepID=A0AAF0U6Y4_SOLVR|nr:hypothetical protein MTR67_033701 [Solanum verrucosum]
MEGTSGEFEKEKILSYKAEMQSNEPEVEHNEKQEAQPPSASMPSSLPTELSPPVEKPQKLQRRKSGPRSSPDLEDVEIDLTMESLPRERDIDFAIELEPGTWSISIPSYPTLFVNGWHTWDYGRSRSVAP